MQIEADSGDVDSDHQPPGRDEARIRVRCLPCSIDDPLPHLLMTLNFTLIFIIFAVAL